MLTFEKELPDNTGIPSTCILNLIHRLEAHQIPMHSLLILHHDKLITEAYYAPCRPDTLHRMFSISKSFTSIAIGLLAEEGKLSINDPIVNYFPEFLPANVHPFLASMTIRDMLMMRTCHAQTTYKKDPSVNWVKSYFITPPTHPSGTLFHYDTSAAHTLCALVEKLTGMDMLDYLKLKLSPLGLSKESYMLKDPFGTSMGGTGLVATSMDLLKFGYFIAHKGEINGIQLLSSDYIDLATSKLSDTCVTAPIPSEAAGYGLQFWRNEQCGYTCYGMGGQLIIFLPEHDLICVTTADTQGIGGGNQQIYDALYEEVLPHISSSYLPIHSGTFSSYMDALTKLAISPVSGEISSPVMEQISGKNYLFCYGKTGYRDVCISFSKRDKEKTDSNNTVGHLSFTYENQKYQIDFGLGFLVSGILPIYDFKCAASGAWLADGTLYIKVHVIDSSVGSIKFQLSFQKDSLTIFMRKQEETLFQEFDGHIYCTI